MREIAAHGSGVMVMLHDWKASGVLDFVTGRHITGQGPERMLREYGIGAQILADLGVGDMILLTNNPRTIVGLEDDAVQLRIAEQVKIKISRSAIAGLQADPKES